ncbi:DoxX family protein [Commensalibacter oyaizuii]|uniref:DoxX family protein n=1 Tax=Commensalibacter oyaizuii TaxID=3043873 RepID=A0ABT6PZQ3_9PROT|nr:DoxX family protein [Commensalibacter sp. TBRC 16381]MDI2090198.1 DoxX family protein [Commensalibacter sp. TBRC 16381]
MAKPCKKIWHSLVGLGFAACGISKVMGVDIQEKRFSALNWSESNMKTLGGAQIAGAALLTCKKTSKLGALLLAATALCLFFTGLKHNRKEELAIDSVGVIAALSLLFCKKK